MNKKTVFVLGGDGFCGWPTALQLASEGWKVVILDNFIRRAIDVELGTQSLTPISSMEERLLAANHVVGDISFEEIDIAKEPHSLRELISDHSPSVIVHFAEQRAAPYSMNGDVCRRYTVDNNTTGTHNLLSAIVDTDLTIALIHLGTMGVYGYSKDFGAIPEGYLDVTIKQTQNDVEILYPANPGSVYHMTKCLDQLLFQFYVKNWSLNITDLHQGIVWGTQTEFTRMAPELANRFDYDGMYGTVLNRFLSQAANGNRLTVYGSGGQTRAFIHVQDTARCVSLAAAAALNRKSLGKVVIYNQVSETRSVKDLAVLVSELFSIEVEFLPNPRKELAENELEVSNSGLRSLGFEPILLSEGLITDVHNLAESCSTRFDARNVLTSPTW